MEITNDIVTNDATQAPFSLKGSFFTLTTMSLHTDNLCIIEQHLQHLVSETPNFFKYMPLVIDVSQQSTTLDFTALANMLRAKHIIPLGIRGGTADLNNSAIAAGFATFPKTIETTPRPAKANRPEPVSSQESVATDSKPHIPAVTNQKTLLITQPIRSGQQVFAKHGDLVILSSVGHGAEVIATGNVHVYGPMRGRALAGVAGDTSARIFCRELEAELLSVAGHYMVKENMDNGAYAEFFGQDKQLKQVFLDDGHLQIATL